MKQYFNNINGIFVRDQEAHDKLNSIPSMSFDTVEKMIVNNELKEGMVVETLGYYQKYDGGGSKYIIKIKTDKPGSVQLSNMLIAELIDEEHVKNILHYGAKRYEDDNTFDNTFVIQSLIDAYSNVGVKILIPIGNFRVNGTINLRPNVTIKGVSTPHVASERSSNILHYPSNQADLFTLDEEDKSYGYVFNIEVKNLGLRGNGVSNHAFKLNGISKLYMDNVSIMYFNTGIYIQFGMLNKFENVNIRYFRNYGVFIDNNGMTTRQYFDNCYIGQSTSSQEAIPLYITRQAVHDCTFNHLTVESCEKGIFISPENLVNFNNIYVEHVPATIVGSTLNIGLLKDESTIASGNKDNTVAVGNYVFGGLVTFNGGVIQGSNTIAYSTSGKIMCECDCLDSIVFKDLKYISFYIPYSIGSNFRGKVSFENTSGLTIYSDISSDLSSRLKVTNCRTMNNQTIDDMNSLQRIKNCAAALNQAGWYRVASFENSGVYGYAALITICTSYSNNDPQSFLLGLAGVRNGANLTKLSGVFPEKNIVVAARIVDDNGTHHLEVKYFQSKANNVSVDIIGRYGEKVNFTPNNETPTSGSVIATLTLNS